MSSLIALLKLMRFDKPIGTLLLLWPTLWALWIAAGGFPGWHLLLVFIAGVVIMRSAGCIINDYADRNIDQHVARTQHRPLTAGFVSNTTALILFVVLCCIALGLVLTLNRLALWVAIPALLLTILYPFTKRFFAAPQLVLGVTFSFGIPMAFAAVLNALPLISWVIFFANLVWVIAYDTEYAMTDRQDDLTVGLKSTAILFGQRDVLIVSSLNGFFMLIWLCVAIAFSFSVYFYLAWLIALGLLTYQFTLYKTRRPELCFKAFLNNHWVGFVVFIGLLMG